MCASARHKLGWTSKLIYYMRKYIHKLKAELKNIMCYQLNFMSNTEPCKVDVWFVDFLKHTADAMWSLSLEYC